MKLLKYLAVIIFILFILVNVLTRLPIVQDRIMMTALNNAVNANAELPDNALSALVCGSGPPLASPGAGQSCILIKAGDEYFIVDIGDGASCHVGYKSCFYRSIPLGKIDQSEKVEMKFEEKEKKFDPEKVYKGQPNPTKL